MLCMSFSFKKDESGDFPGGPVVKTSPSNAGGTGSILCWGAKILLVLKKQKQKTSKTSILTNSVKTLKMVHLKKSFKKT